MCCSSVWKEVACGYGRLVHYPHDRGVIFPWCGFLHGKIYDESFQRGTRESVGDDEALEQLQELAREWQDEAEADYGRGLDKDSMECWAVPHGSAGAVRPVRG